MNRFLADPDIHSGFIDANRSRLVAAGVDPYEYNRVTATILHIADWPDAFIRTAEAHRELARTAASPASVHEAYRDAALWFHFATVLPDPDDQRRTYAATEAADAICRALDVPAIADPHPTEGFTGYLRLPSGVARPPVVILVPGMNSSATEFVGLTDLLLRRDLAVLAIDGPGQGATPGHWQPEFERVIARAIDALPADTVDVDAVGVFTMSMGGLFGARAAAYEPRVRALVAVSGPSAFRWDDFVPYVAETFVQRTGGASAAREFAESVNVAELAERVTQPVRVVEGSRDVIPGVWNLEVLARKAERGEFLLIEDGNHLVEEHRYVWLPQTADWIAGQLK